MIRVGVFAGFGQESRKNLQAEDVMIHKRMKKRKRKQNENKMGDGQRGGCIKCMKIRFLQGSYAE